MENFYIDMGLSIVITLIRSIKGPKKIAQFRAVFRKINTLIAGVYGNDPEFKAIWTSLEE